MGKTVNHVLGRQAKHFLAYESTVGTYVKPVGSAAVKCLSMNISRAKEFADRTDSRQTRSLLERIEGKSAVAWDLEAYLIPGNTPPLHQLYWAALGSYSLPTYSLASSQQCRTLSLTRSFDGTLGQACWGAWVEELKIAFTGGDNPKVTASGGAMGFAHTGYTTLDGAVSASPNITVDDQYSLDVNSMVQIGTDDNSGAGFLVSTDSGSGAFVLDASGTAGDGDDVLPFTPTETTSGSPVPGIKGSLTWDSVALPVVSGEVTITNNIKPFDDEAFKEYPDDVIPNYRRISGMVKVRARRDHVIHHQNRDFIGDTRPITIVLGSTGALFTLSLPTAEMDFNAVEVPEEEEGILTLPFVALATSSGDDEMTLAHHT